MRENYIILAGYQRRERKAFDRMRLQAYITAKFGNSNPKKFPKTVEQFMPSPYDEAPTQGKAKSIREQYEENQRLLQEALAKKKREVPDVIKRMMAGEDVEEEKKAPEAVRHITKAPIKKQ